MTVISIRDFRSNQGKYLGLAAKGESVILTSRAGSFKIVPVSEDDSLISKKEFFARVSKNSGFKSFQVIARTFFDNEREILNFFDNRSTNASAESFNCKIKNFRAQLRGVSDVKYFLFRLQNIYA